ncbi:succinate--CoA ligase [GDP-forming] subunit beta, mitochondrial isoform X1 [Salmo trutta]|uniref:succinate--CoA ligase [GDP-forming] subunit beta, mitochondrial isoform X1 n=1 Tax=Salmo trutta TaxID=8032 RepID=UPI001131A519|nr:succinate--CoA ligase [GDP-forming] subunit beta, mitochondrial isoform X1 [Salmo trutta]
MAASIVSQTVARGLRGASANHLFLDKFKCARVSCRRWLNLQEYQSKKLMQESGVTVQRFYVADNAPDALQAAKRLGAKEIVLKAQILAGGRGKGVFDSGLKGGVHLTKDPSVVGELAKKMLGYSLTTKQTPKEGVKVKTVMVAEALDITRETYFAILMDRACNGPVMVGSPQGGMDIEEVADKTPELIFKEVIDIFEGVRDDQALRMAANLGFKGPLERQAADQIKRLYDLFLKVDATQVEVNPLGETPEGQVVCFDAKINFDDNAEFRQKAVFAMDDMSESDPTEMEAAKWDLKYIGLDGNIACFVNGAGLAMATCDIIDLHGGKPANFLDLGGGVKEKQVYEAFKLLTADPKVEAILVNIFGGIVNCAIIANGITKACRELELKVPLVVRLEGQHYCFWDTTRPVTIRDQCAGGQEDPVREWTAHCSRQRPGRRCQESCGRHCQEVVALKPSIILTSPFVLSCLFPLLSPPKPQGMYTNPSALSNLSPSSLIMNNCNIYIGAPLGNDLAS